MQHPDPALLVVMGGVSAALHVGKLAPALPVLSETLGVTLVQAGFLLSLVQLAGMTLGLLVGLAADGLGLKRTMVAGLLILSACEPARRLGPRPGAAHAVARSRGTGLSAGIDAGAQPDPSAGRPRPA